MQQKKVKNELWEWVQAIVIAVVLALIIRTFVFEIIQVEGYSMLPTLNDGDRLIVVKLGYRFSLPERGDIVIFRTPENEKINYVKRVIGIPGDTVEVKNGRVYVNGRPLAEPYINEPPRKNFPKTQVPPGTVFVMGDNRNHSKDSRDPHVGFVPLKNIVGKAVFRVWPFTHMTCFK